MADDIVLRGEDALAEELGDFLELNDSELVALAQHINPRANRYTDRLDLLRILAGEEVELPARSIDAVRLHIMKFVNQNYDQLRPLLDCPAKTRDPRACFRCLDYQVAECATSSAATIFGTKDNEHE